MTFDGRTFNSVYATTNSVITFGAPDGTYWDYPQTPSISLYSFDWVVYPGWRSDEHLIIRSSDGGFQVDISARPIWLQNATEPTNIVITAAILSDGTVAMAYTLTGPLYPENNPRTGVRLNDGTIETFQEYGITQTTSRPNLAAEPTDEAPFTPEPPAPFLNAPTNLIASQLEDGAVQLTWDAPAQTSTSVERYAVSFSTNNFSTGWGVASTTNSIVLSREVFETSGGLDQTYQFRIRSDNDTLSIYSQYSQTASVLVASPPPPAPIVPDGAEVINEGSSFEVVAPVGQRIANAVGYYGDPNDSTRGGEVSSILFELLAGETSATVEVSNETFANDPAPGTPKILIILITYEDIPVQSAPPSIPEQPVTPEPIPLPEEPVIEPSPEPTTVPPTEEPTPEPAPSEEPVEEPTEVEPEPLPEPESPSPTEILGELEDIAPEDLSELQVAALLGVALTAFDSAEEGSAEYEAALDILAVLAIADDPELPAALEGIPGAEEVLAVFNAIGNFGADMSPQAREEAEKVVVTAIVSVNAALSAAVFINAATPPVPSAPTGGAPTSGSGPTARGKV